MQYRAYQSWVEAELRGWLGSRLSIVRMVLSGVWLNG